MVKVHHLNSFYEILVFDEYCGLIEIPVETKSVFSQRIIMIKNTVLHTLGENSPVSPKPVRLNLGQVIPFVETILKKIDADCSL